MNGLTHNLEPSNKSRIPGWSLGFSAQFSSNWQDTVSCDTKYGHLDVTFGTKA